MKKILNIVFIIMFCIVLSACDKKENYGGKNAEFNLEANATTGFEWNYTLSDEAMLNVVENEYIPNETAENIVGSGGTQKYVFVGLKEGEVNIVFTYSRPWDKVTEPIYKITYTLKVEKNLNISMIKKDGNYFAETLPDPIFE